MENIFNEFIVEGIGLKPKKVCKPYRIFKETHDELVKLMGNIKKVTKQNMRQSDAIDFAFKLANEVVEKKYKLKKDKS
jgi:hypothetical protein